MDAREREEAQQIQEGVFDEDVMIVDIDGDEIVSIVSHMEVDDVVPSVYIERNAPRSALTPRFTLKQRRRQGLLTGVIVLVAFAILLGSSASTQSFLLHAVWSFLPTPPPTLAPGDDQFYVVGTPHNGKLFLDGKEVSRVPSLLDTPLRLTRGQHTLRWQAPPFQARQCSVSVPVDLHNDSCRGALSRFPAPKTQTLIWYLHLVAPFPSLAKLPNEERKALVADIQDNLNALSLTQDMKPGEVYATSSPSSPIATAKVALKARLHFALDLDPNSAAPCIDQRVLCTIRKGQDCHLLCDVSEIVESSGIGSYPLDQWMVYAVVRPLWDYTTSDGTVIARDQPDSTFSMVATTSDQIGGGFAHLLSTSLFMQGNRFLATIDFSDLNTFIARGKANWLDTIESNTPVASVCAAQSDETETFPSFIRILQEQQYLQLVWRFGVTRLGCLGETTLPHSPALQAYVLHRFGIDYAVNDAAHKQWPNLPVVSDTLQPEIQMFIRQLHPESGDPSIPS